MNAYPIVWTDTFVNTTLGSAWVVQQGSFVVSSNSVYSSTPAPSFSYATLNVSSYSAPTDQSAGCQTYATSTSGLLCGPVVRASASGGYFAAATYFSSSAYKIYKFAGQTLTEIYSGAMRPSHSSAAVYMLRAEGDRLTLWTGTGGVGWGLCAAVNDSTYTSGQPGFAIYLPGDNPLAKISAFQARESPVIPPP